MKQNINKSRNENWRLAATLAVFSKGSLKRLTCDRDTRHMIRVERGAAVILASRD